MEIKGTCEIEIAVDITSEIDQKTLDKFSEGLTRVLSCAVDNYLSYHGLYSKNINSCVVNDLSTNKSEKKFSVGDEVRLISELNDDRPTTIKSARADSCTLEESRGGYYYWNNGDLEHVNKE